MGYQDDLKNLMLQNMNFSSPTPGAGSQGFGGDLAQTGALAAFGGPVGVGLGVASAGVNYLAGSGQRKRKKQAYSDFGDLYNRFLGERGKSVLNTGKLMNARRAGFDPRAKELGAKYDQQFGFDSGAGKKAFIRELANTEPDAYANIENQNQRLTSSRDADLYRLALQAKQSQSQFI